jgi:hypothetical protein
LVGPNIWSEKYFNTGSSGSGAVFFSEGGDIGEKIVADPVLDPPEDGVIGTIPLTGEGDPEEEEELLPDLFRYCLLVIGLGLSGGDGELDLSGAT